MATVWQRIPTEGRDYHDRKRAAGNASTVASATLGPFTQPHHVASTIPGTLPIAQPVRQSKVAWNGPGQPPARRWGRSPR
jgi:hypothetical protein